MNGLDNMSLAALVALIAVNYVVPRTAIARSHPWVFWAINGLDLAVGLGALLFGVPGFEGKPLVRFMVGLLVLLHLAQNFQVKTRWDAEDRMDRLEHELRERQALQATEGAEPEARHPDALGAMDVLDPDPHEREDTDRTETTEIERPRSGT